MLNRRLIFASFILLFTACQNEIDPKEIIETQIVKADIPDLDEFNYDTLKGIYIGDFGGTDIRIILRYVSQNNAVGYNIHKGLQRNITGKTERFGDSILMTLNEPGDNEFDGVFQLLFIGEDIKPTGSWKSNSGKISPKNFKLEKQIKQTGETDEINSSNFTDHFGYVSDTVGNYSFEDDGLCLFEYYPNEDYNDRMAQLSEIQGTWSLKGKTLTIDWEENTHFKERKMILQITKDEYDEFILWNKTNILYRYYY